MSFKKVLLIKPSKIAAGGLLVEQIPIGLEYIAAYIRDHVEKVDIIDLFKDKKNVKYHLNKFKPDLVGISIQEAVVHNEALQIAKEAKEVGASVVVGGYHATGLAEELAAHPDIDFVARGEGEETMLELVKKGSAEGVKGISYSKDGKVIHNEDRPLIKDLDSIPYPARKLRKYKYTAPTFAIEYDVIMTSLGCWGKCKYFCCEYAMCKGAQRYRKPDKVAKELKEILEFHKNKDLMMWIADPNFGGNPKIAEEVCDKIIEIQSKRKAELRFIANIRVDVIANNVNLVRKMIKAGIDIIVLGIETPNEKHLGFINKEITQKLQKQAVDNFRSNGGKIYGTFPIALPYQTEEDVLECINYAKILKIDFPAFMIVTPFPPTDLYNELKSKGDLLIKDWDKYDYFTLVFKHKSLTTQKARELLLRAWADFYNDLSLKYEYREVLRKKKKSKLYIQAVRAVSAFNSWRTTIIREADSLADYSLYLNGFINPDLKRFTKEVGLHNIFEISRFLRILGDQKIQITINNKNKPAVSWIIKTTKKEIEYIDSTEEIINDASISINICLEDVLNNKTHFDIGKKMIKRILNDNKGIKSKLNLIKLFAAIGSEALAYYFNI